MEAATPDLYRGPIVDVPMNGHIVLGSNGDVYMVRPGKTPMNWPRTEVTPLCWRRVPIHDPMAIYRLVDTKP